MKTRKIFCLAMMIIFGMASCTKDPVVPTGTVFINNIQAGTLNGLFSVSATCKVHFSCGNLQYKPSIDTWRFALNQYDCVGYANGGSSSTYDDWIDLFGWATSGYDHGATHFQPWSTVDDLFGYNAYGQDYYNLNDKTGQADWGYNAISNGGCLENNGWRTLTKDEWIYVLNTRNTFSNIRFVKAQVNNVNGMVILPDDWSANNIVLTSVNNGNSSYSNNVINSLQWNDMESKGAVFLPAAGYRIGSTVSLVDSYGFYWSANNYYHYVFTPNSVDAQTQIAGWGNNAYGRSVRLVRNAE